MSTQSLGLDPSIANLPLDLLRKKYDELTPAERKLLGFVRPATDAEVERGFSPQAAPTDFGGRVFANPDNVQASDDTDSGVPVTRLPTGVSLNRGNYTGDTKFDVSNPEQTGLLAPEMRTVAAQSQPQADDWFSQNAPAKTVDSGGDWFDANAPAKTESAQSVSPPAKAEPSSAASRLGENFLSGLGVTSNEQAKQFFAHPIDTLLQSVNAQGELAEKARDAYKHGDYKAAVMHGLNYLIPFIGQQTDQAGEQLKEGDIAGGVGRTLGVAAPLVVGSPEARALPGKTIEAARPVIKGTAGAVKYIDPDVVGIASPRAGNAMKVAQRAARVVEKYTTPQETSTGATVYRDATLNRRNIPEYAGEEIAEPEVEATTQTYSAAPSTSVTQTVGSVAASTADTNHFQQARQELGADAPLTKVVDRAQELKTGKTSTPEAEFPRPVIEYLKTPQGKKFLRIYRKTLEEHQAGKFKDVSPESFEEDAPPPKKPPQGTVTPETSEEMQDALTRSLRMIQSRRR